MGADNSMWLSGQAVYKKSKVNLTIPLSMKASATDKGMQGSAEGYPPHLK